MSELDTTRVVIAELWEKVALEQARAARAGVIAARYEATIQSAGDALRPLRARMAALHRRTEQRHLISARLQATHAAMLQSWLDASNPDTARPRFVRAIAANLGRSSVLITLEDSAHHEAMVSASDGTARTAHDVERVLGEGPAADAIATGEPVRFGGPELVTRYPYFGPVVRQIGVRAVLAVPLLAATDSLGAMCILDQLPDIGDDLVMQTSRVAEALTRTVFRPPDHPIRGGNSNDPLWLFGAADFPDAIHQAAGMLSVRYGHDIGDAIALLRARAFADGRDVEEVARDVLWDGSSLD